MLRQGVIFLFGLLDVITAIAAEGDATEHFWHGLPPAVFNFCVLVGVGIYFGRRPFKEFFERRAQDIERIVKRNNDTYTKLLEEFDRYGKQTDGLKSEQEELIESAHKDGKRGIAQAKTSAKKTLEDYQRDVQETIEIETAELKRELAVDLLELSMKKWTQELKSSSAKLSHAYVDQFKKNGDKANLSAS